LNGRRFAMNEHFMFKGDDGKVIGVVVFARSGWSNAAVEQLWAHMPQVKGPSQDVAGLSVDPGDLLPRARGYFRYTGSISAPPCSGGVVWYVLKEPIEVSPAQVAAFARLYPRDIRELQPLNGRAIEESRAN
jgi:carbonic anhydrase